MLFAKSSTSKEIILGYSINSSTGSNQLSTWDLTTSKIRDLKIPELEPLKFPSICKIGKNLYFITGGLINKNSLSSQTWILNTKTEKIFAAQNLKIACYDSYLIKKGNKIFSISGKKSFSEIINNFCYYSLIHLDWFDLPALNFAIKGIKSVFFDEIGDLYVLLHPNKMVRFSFEENKWIFVKNFVYDFTRFFVTRENKCLLFNTYHNVVYEYNFYEDTIKTKFLLDDMQISDAFYISEADSIVFVDNEQNQMFLVYNCKEESLKYYDSYQYNQFFGVFRWFRTYNNFFLKKNDFYKQTNCTESLENKVFIFGNFHHPFKLTLDFKNDKITNDFFPESLHLKNEQALDFYDKENLLFAGGYDDDVSFHTTSDCYLYNPLKNENNKFTKLTYNLGDCYLDKIEVEGKSYHFVISAKNDIQMFDEEKNSWEEIDSLGLTNNFPISLNLKNELTVFFIENLNLEDQRIVFKTYDIKNKKWEENFSKDTKKVINLVFCKKIKQNEYLVIENGEKSEFISKMTIFKNEEDLIEDIIFEKIVKLSMFHIKAYILSYFVIEKMICFIFVNSNFVLNFVGFDMESKEIVKNEKIKKIQSLVQGSLCEMRLERYLWTFGTFSVIGQSM